jgi:hypothetical protein
MARVLTNNVSLAYAIESSIGTLPGSPTWRVLEPNDIGRFGAEITTVARRPISKNKQRRKGTVTDLTSGVEFNGDLTMSAFQDFAEGFVFAEWANTEFYLRATGAVNPPSATATTDVFNIAAASTLLGGKLVYALGGAKSLLFAKGYAQSANNGLHVLDADVAPTDTTASVASTLVTETPPTSASLVVAGVRVIDADLTFTKSGSTATLVSAADITNWATLGIQAGMFIHIGSADANGAVQNALSDSTADDTYGYARVSSVSGATLNLDKLDPNLAASADNSGTGVADILFGRFLRNVAVDADADDNRYLERSFQFEATYPDLGGVGTDKYEYAAGNFANEMSLNLPLADKATVDFGFVGTDTEPPTTTRATNADSAILPNKVVALNTSTNIAVLSTDVVSAVSDVCFKSLTLTINNAVTPEQCLGTLGAAFVNSGILEVSLSGQMLFTDSAIVSAVRNNTTVTFLAIIANEDGALCLDLPSMTLGGGDKEFPVDQSVLVNLTGETFEDATLGTSIGISMIEGVPYVAA